LRQQAGSAKRQQAAAVQGAAHAAPTKLFGWARAACIALAALLLTTLTHAADDTGKPWWDKKWPSRKLITIDTSDKGVAIKEDIGTASVLIRLHDGDFTFLGSKEDGSDLRFVADDHKTLLKHHVEKWDSLLNEAYVWVQVPDLKASTSKAIWLYCANVTDAANVGDAKACFSADTIAAYHFADSTDATGKSGNLEGAGSPVASSLAGPGLRVLGAAPITIPGTADNEWAAGSALTWAAWFKPTSLQANAVLFARRDGANAFVIVIDNGTPFVEVNKQRSTAGAAILPAQWHHLAVIASGSTINVLLDGVTYGTLAAPLPALKGPSLIGKDSSGTGSGFVGELDELTITKAAMPAGWAKFATLSQGITSDAQKLVGIGIDEAANVHKPGLIEEHVHLIGDISKDLSPDGWLVIGLCTILAVVGWVIALTKLLYLNKISKATTAFMEQWEKVSGDLTVLDNADQDSIKTMGGNATTKRTQKLMHQSPLYHIYHLGCTEVMKRMNGGPEPRLDAEGKPMRGLAGRSIQAIKATLHGGLMREVQKLNGKLVFLTIGIAGGPYLGLLGTVIGVMITFAVIAKSGQVEVNSIAPGIAGALLATVAGLAVAIPALFAYSYLSSRIKDAVTDMESFIDEFITRMAEHYKE
jgi:biopolymer transport protein ExbB